MEPAKLEALRQATEAWVSEKFALGSFDPDRHPALSITASNSVKKMQAGVSPDCAFRLVKAAIEAARVKSVFIFTT